MLLCTLNTHSLKDYINDIVNGYDIMSSNILCLQELHMHPSQMNNVFEQFHSYAIHNIYGISTLTKKHLLVSKIKEHKKTNVEAITVTILEANNEINICNVYAKPNAPILEITKIINEVVTYANIINPLYIISDFNIDMCNKNKTTRIFLHQMQLHKVQLLLNEAHSLNKPLIDHIWSNSTANICSIYKLDHLATFINVHHNQHNNMSQCYNKHVTNHNHNSPN